MSTDKRRFPEASSTVGVGLLNMHEDDLRRVLSLTSFNSSNVGLVVSSAQRIGIFRIPSFTSTVSPDLAFAANRVPDLVWKRAARIV